MSTMTTSASSLSAMQRATVAPTLPAPPTTVTLRFICCSSNDDQRGRLAEAAELQAGCALRVSASSACRIRRVYMLLMIASPNSDVFSSVAPVHQPREVVGDALGGDRAVHPLDDQVGGLVPAEVSEHHLAREDHRARVDLVLVGVLRRGAVRRLEDGVAGHVVDVAARRDADAADLRRQRVGQVVAVQVRRRDDVELVGPRQHLLQRDVGDGVLDDDAGARLAVGNPAPRSAVDLDRAEERPSRPGSPSRGRRLR